MNSLRVVLLIIGILVVAAIYLWGTRGGAKPKTRRRHYDGIKLDPASPGDGSHSTPNPSAKITLDPKDLRADPMPSQAAQPLPTQTPSPTPLPASREAISTGPQPGSTPSVVELFIVAPQGYRYTGSAVFEALQAVDMQLGDMDVFHHRGVGEMRAPTPLFSLANMLNPGTFDAELAEQPSTPGLAIFIQLPVAVEGPLAFELMLHTAQRLAELLSGDVCDADQKPLSVDKLDELRAIVAQA